MTFLLAFLLGGALSAFAQIIFMLAKLKNPVQCLIICFGIGGLLGVFGVVPMLEELCQAGMIATAFDPGFGILGGAFGLIGGDPSAIIALMGTIVTMIVMGIITGVVTSSRTIAEDVQA